MFFISHLFTLLSQAIISIQYMSHRKKNKSIIDNINIKSISNSDLCIDFRILEKKNKISMF